MTALSIIREPGQDVEVITTVDVAVVGGGTAGVMAAIGAVRSGVRTCVIERFGTLGGALSMGVVGYFYNRFRDSAGHDLVGGAPREFLGRLIAAGATPYADIDKALGCVAVYFRHEYAGYVAMQMCCEQSVELWLQTRFCRALSESGSGYVLFVECKGGRKAIRARQVVDCSGEADVAVSVGADVLSETHRSWGLIFHMDKVNGDRYTAFLEGCDVSCPSFTPWLANYLGISAEELKRDTYWGAWIDGGRKAWKFRPQIMAAVDAGDIALVRDLPGGGQIRYGWDGFALEPYPNSDKAVANVCMVTGLDPGRGEDVSKAEVAARNYAFEFLGFLRKHIPGFENAVISFMGGQTMPRGGRTIVGEAGLTVEDFVKGRIRDDAICIGIQNPERSESIVHGLPLGMFVPKGVDNLLVAGKCAAGGYAVRGTVYCMASGYSCGIVAGLAAKCETSPLRIDRSEIRKALRRQGVVLAVGDATLDKRKGTEQRRQRLLDSQALNLSKRFKELS